MPCGRLTWTFALPVRRSCGHSRYSKSKSRTYMNETTAMQLRALRCFFFGMQVYPWFCRDARGWDRVLPGDVAAPRPLLYPLTQSVWLHRNLLERFDGLFLIGGISGHDFLTPCSAGVDLQCGARLSSRCISILRWWNHCWIRLGWLASLELLRPRGCGSVAAPWIAAWRYSSLASSCSPCCGKRSRTVG